MKRSPEVDTYIATFPQEIRTRLSRVRRAVRAAAPMATEIISYRIPAYRGNGVLVFFAGFREHIGFYPPIRGDAAIVRAAAKYAGPKGNLKFPHTDPLPLKLIARIVRLRVKQDAARGASKKNKSR